MKTVWKFLAYHPTNDTFTRNEYYVEAPTQDAAFEYLCKSGFFDISRNGHISVYCPNELN